ncbi:MAG: DNA polymerase I [Thermoguttaceae bacterium]|nr:DNA polymerase I [Thermoguttaceae bacterium]MDW8078311.1 DNA polymerase I [Thermoguttaceae bacterium]
MARKKKDTQLEFEGWGKLSHQPPQASTGPKQAGRSAPSVTAGGAKSSRAELSPQAAAVASREEFQPADSPLAAPPPLEEKSVWIVDTHALVHQLYHAMPEMASPQGEPVAVVFGFARDILFLLRQKKPDFLFCAIDVPGKTFRHEKYEAYKANRPEMPEDLQTQIALVYELIEAFGIPLLGCVGYEADDVMATVARLTEEAGGTCYLVTGDKDCRQLISDRVFLYNIRKDQVFDLAALKAEWGIEPGQVVDFQALVGDSTDNVPGIPKVGPKTAQQILECYGSLDALLADGASKLRPNLRELVLAHQKEALLSRELVRLCTDVPVRIDWRPVTPACVDQERVRELFRRLGFRSLARDFEHWVGQAPTVKVEGPPPPKRHAITSVDELKKILRRIRSAGRMSLDTETTDIRPRWAKLVGISMACSPEEGWYIPIRAPAGEPRLDESIVIELIRPVLEDPGVVKIGQNLKYDLVVLRCAGIKVAGASFDCMVASYLLEPGARSHGLDELAYRFLGYQTIKIGSLIGSGKRQRRMDEVPLAEIVPYAVDDAVLPLRLEAILRQKLGETGLSRLFEDVEMPLVSVLAEMEYTGVRVDPEVLARLERELSERLARLEAEIHTLAGEVFNINSPKQLQQVLFEKLGLPVIKKTATGPSTDVEVLEELVDAHPVVPKLVEYRQIAKLLGTYVQALPEMICPHTGRIHASFHQAVTATGRLSSSDPNLQNIPVRTEEGRQIRSAFVPGRKGWKLLSADYSQIELRVLAHFSQDPRLCEAFARDEDIHARVASQIYGVPLAEVTPEMRRKAKAVNFGVIYGQTPYGLAQQLRIPQEEAAQFIDAYFASYPAIESFMAEVLRTCRENGYVTTILGRRRPISGVRANPGRQKNLAERTAINTVIQGSAADLIKLAMIGIDREIARRKLPAQMLLQIHDELVFEVAEEALPETAVLVGEVMASAYPLRVPLKVDLAAGPSWGELQAIDLSRR